MDDRLDDVLVERPAPSKAVVTFSGEHDLAARDAVERLLHSLVEENDLVVADFSEATFIDSTMMHVLVTADTAARQRGARFRLQLGTAAIVERAFELSGLLQRLDSAHTREEALADPPAEG